MRNRPVKYGPREWISFLAMMKKNKTDLNDYYSLFFLHKLANERTKSIEERMEVKHKESQATIAATEAYQRANLE